MKMAYIPEAVRATALIMMLVAAGLKHLNSGKSGELFELTSGYMLMVRTDRVSIFDFVLNGLVPFKGSILTAMTVLWLTKVLAPVLEKYGGHHLVAYGSGIDAHLPVDGRPIVGINNLDPENTEHVKFVSSVEVPWDVLQGTTDLYLNGFELLFGKSLEKFWEEAGVKMAA